MTNTFENEAPKYWEINKTVVPVPKGTKGGFKKWPHFIDSIPSEKNKADWIEKHADDGIAVLTGQKMHNGNMLIAIDCDDDEYIGFINRYLGAPVSGKRGQKGITHFVMAEPDVKHTQIKCKEDQILDVLVRKCCNVPPTIHPKTNQPYIWHGDPLYNVDFNDLPVVTAEEIKLMNRLLSMPEHKSLLVGQSTHDDAISITATLSNIFNTDFLLDMMNALLPDDYKGNLRDELPEMISSAVQKNLGQGGNQIYEPQDIGPIPKGFTDNGYYVFLNQSKDILSILTPTQLTKEADLFSLAPKAFWLDTFPKINADGIPCGIDKMRAGDTLIRACHDAGPFNPSRVRGLGIWREGKQIMQNLRGPLPESTRYTYIRFGSLPDFDNETQIDPNRVYDWLRQFNWADEGYATLLMGWTALAPICGALDWRTHVFIHGAKKTGKSTLIHGLTSLLDPMAVVLDGTSTEAGIRQSIAADSRPVVLDEFESDNQVSRMKNVLKLARSASSGTAPIARGTPEGKALQFQVHSSFCFGAIIPIIGTAADRSRIVELELLKHNDDENVRLAIEEGQAYFDAHRYAWCNYVIGLIDEMTETFDILRRQIPSGDMRHKTNMVNLLGATFVTIHQRSPNEDEAKEWIDKHASLIASLAVAHEGDDAEECLNHLMEFVAEKDSPSIGEMLRQEKDRVGDHQEYHGPTLLKLGIKAMDDGFLIAHEHSALNKVFKDTLWSGGGWKNALKRLTGAKVGDQFRSRFAGGGVKRGVFIPYINIMDD
jgi:hypothetical protein